MTEGRTGMLDDLAVRDQTRPERPGPDRTSPSLDGPAAAHHATRRAGTFVNDHEAGSLRCESDVHDQFGLSYASYLVVPRSLLQLMPGDWQHALVELLEEFGDAFLVCVVGGGGGRFEGVDESAVGGEVVDDARVGRGAG